MDDNTLTPVFVSCIGFHSIGLAKIETIIMFPRGFVTSIACLNVGATPATSKDTSTPSATIARTACTGFSLPELIAWVAPNSFAFSNRCV